MKAETVAGGGSTSVRLWWVWAQPFYRALAMLNIERMRVVDQKSLAKPSLEVIVVSGKRHGRPRTRDINWKNGGGVSAAL